MKEYFKHVDTELVFRGCLTGGDRHEREDSYNQTIISAKPELKKQSFKFKNG
jgi:hypothetical protein